MKNLFEQIEHTKGKPHHIRKRVAFGTAAGITSLIALIWFSVSIGTGAFTIAGSSFADSTAGVGTVTTSAPNTNQNLAGAVAGIPAPLPADNQNAASGPARINIIDVASSTSKQKAEPTIIPF